MKPTTREWVKKAENDFKVAAQILPAFPGAEAVARLDPNPQESLRYRGGRRARFQFGYRCCIHDQNMPELDSKAKAYSSCTMP